MADGTSNTYVQRRFGVTVTNELAPDVLRYTLRDASGARSFSVAYDNLLLKDPPTLTVRAPAAQRAAALLGAALLGIAGAMIARIPGAAILVPFLLLAMLGVIALRLFPLFTVSFTQLPAIRPVPGSNGHLVRIMHGRDHDLILATIRDRWRARMMILHGSVNGFADPIREKQKFRWLHDQGVIDGDQLRRFLAEVDLIHGPQAEGGDPLVN